MDLDQSLQLFHVLSIYQEVLPLISAFSRQSVLASSYGGSSPTNSDEYSFTMTDVNISFPDYFPQIMSPEDNYSLNDS
jgi:hypothetical protein